MLQYIYKCFAMMTCVLALCHSASARYVSEMELLKQALSADVICTGSTVSMTAGKPDSNGVADIEITFRIDRSLKGDMKSGTDIKMIFRDLAQMPCPPIRPGYVLATFAKDGDRYVAGNGWMSSIPVCKTAYSQYAQSNDVTSNLQWEILNSLKDTSDSILKAALLQTPVLSPSQIQEFVMPFTESKNEGVQVAALMGLAKANVLGPVLGYLEKKDETDEIRGSILMLKYTTEGAHASPEDIPVIARLTKCRSAELRGMASYLLRMSQGRAALPVLKSLLDDSSLEVRYNAVMGLAEYTKDQTGHAPMMQEFVADEQKYLDYWKNESVY